MSNVALVKMTELEARAYIEKMRWPNGAVCPKCGGMNAYKMEGKAHRVGLWKCRECRGQFTVTVGTIFEDSRVPLNKWVMAIASMCASKKGVSAKQLERELGVTYKTAWFMCHRIRYAMSQDPLRGMLSGVVEADETYIGGKPRIRGKSKRGRGTSKTPVMVLVERGGKARSFVMGRVNGKNLKAAIRENVDKRSTIMTDEWRGYRGVGQEFDGGHHTVNHFEKEYARGEAHSNTAESYFANLKRGVTGIFHHVSKKHLQRYCDEFSFKWNSRNDSEVTKIVKVIDQSGGGRLLYKKPAHHIANHS